MATILRPEDFRTMRWKNGGGVTHEIARHERDTTMLWRLSIAEVVSDGPFSQFPGMTRLLAVIAGKGMVLEAGERKLMALPLAPVRFSGERAIVGRLVAGPVRDLNFIFDAREIAADMRRLDGPAELRPVVSSLAAILSLQGDALVDGTALPVGAVALGEVERLILPAGTSVMVITIAAAPPVTS